ncbi:MAG: ribbon-helix-helix protein, CopG family [Acidobacteria bacterium]|nr:ribbon-helix-helix protein, CopG family [Acidobacteriota bacterium]
MHRTQIILEEWQYQALRARAEQEGRSISDLVREVLRHALQRETRKKSRLMAIEGIAADRSSRGRAHDRFLYGGEGKD